MFNNASFLGQSWELPETLFPTEIGCSKPRFILTFGIIFVYRTAKVCSKVKLFCTSAVKSNFTAHFCSSIN